MSLELQLPKFNHPEVAIFYKKDLSIAKTEVEKILTLPRATLIEDMETIILDLMERDKVLRTQEHDDQWFAFQFHAMWVLVELDAKESLSSLLQLLKQEDDFSNFWFVDYLTEDLWEIFYFLGGDQLEDLKEILLSPGAWVNRIVASTTVEQIYFHQEARRAEILDWYHSVLDAFLAMEDTDKALDSSVVSTIVTDLISFGEEGFIPKIKALGERDLIDPMFAGNATAIAQEIRNPRYSKTYLKREIKTSIFDRYEDAMKWHGYAMKYNEEYRKKNTYEQPPSSDSIFSLPTNTLPPKVQPIKKEKKIGRNEPCPCGSGKKYKKCCLRK